MASTNPDPQPDPQPEPKPRPHAPRRTSAPLPAADRPGRVEAHGIDHVPDAERHGRARELFPVWAAANVNVLSLVVGGVLILMGLSMGQALAVIVAGSLFWAPLGLLAVSGPASGTPSEVIVRAVYGVRANRVNIAVNGWLLCTCYIALNLAAAAVADFVLVERAGIATSSGVKIAVVVVIAVLTLAIGVYGHATMVKLYPRSRWPSRPPSPSSPSASSHAPTSATSPPNH